MPRVIAGFLLGIALELGSGAASARVTRMVIDETAPLPALAGAPASAIAYEQIAGRLFGELDPTTPPNALIQDIALARGADGKVRYVATFVVAKPVDMKRASGLMWHDAPNRGRVAPIAAAEREAGDIVLASAWQGDNAGSTAVRPTASLSGGQWLKLPLARSETGGRITGQVLGRIVNRAGPASQPLLVEANPLPYQPVSLDTRQARLVSRDAETQRGTASGEAEIAAGDWAWARCDERKPFPGTPDPTQICLRAGFDPRKLYQVVFTAADPPVLGIGFAAWRDAALFFKQAKADAQGNANPLAGAVRHSIGRGVSQSGSFLRGWLHLGFNLADGGGMVHDGLWPIVASRRIALNFRWAQPDGVLELYQPGAEGPQWWLPQADTVRGLPSAGILGRCMASRSCPKIIEHQGSAEVWSLKLTPAWVGTDGRADLPLPDNVRRYYLPGSGHGGGVGGFDSSLPGVGLPAGRPACPGNNFGVGLLPANPMPHAETVNALRWHFRQWVVQGALPPPSQYPRLADGTLAPANKTAIGMPALPGLRPTLPEPDFIMPVHDLDFGPQFDPLDGSGVPTLVPPRIRQVLRMWAPRTDADGNERGGVPVVLNDAPLGTYLGWNLTASGERPFHQGQICNAAGGMVPFARTAAERQASGDSRLSLQERYVDHAGYVAAVKRAAERAVLAGFLLMPDARALIRAADDSAVLR